VVVAVSKAGGFGVLGAVGFTPEQLEIELNWIDEHIGDHNYGVDIVIPNKYEGMDSNLSADELAKMLQDMVPQEHLDFARKILTDHGVPLTAEDNENTLRLLGWTEATATPQVEVALKHPKMTLIANALGTPPKDMIEHIHAEGRKVAALCGSPSQARKHADAGVDIVIAQGGEAGGHSGEVGSIVLWPQVVKEVAPVPVLAAGGIGSGQQIAAALALGAQGAWTGSQWLMVEEAENTPVQQAAYIKAGSRDTVRSRSFTGKPARMLKNDWTEAWENPENPKPLGMPLQFMVSGLAVAATHKYPNETVDVAFNPVGQVVGQFQKVEKTSAVIERWVQEYLEATTTLNELNEAAGV
jgi:NAD(P)H-dependent flavin oxidoreductase YrpB (nitropropane dioxygenase family)